MLSRAAVRHLCTPRSIRAASFRQLQRLGQRASRQYATKPTEAAKETSDLPWAIVATVITIPSVYFILQRNPEHHDDHADHGHEGHKKGSEEEGKSKEEEKSDDEGKEEKGDDKEKEEKEDGEGQDEDKSGGDKSEDSKPDDDQSDEDNTKKPSPAKAKAS